jgi:hypothetical protein
MQALSRQGASKRIGRSTPSMRPNKTLEKLTGWMTRHDGQRKGGSPREKEAAKKL